jgi:hypothetical protein
MHNEEAHYLQARNLRRVWDKDFHPTPRRQLAVMLAGRAIITVTDGETVSVGPGDAFLSQRSSQQGPPDAGSASASAGRGASVRLGSLDLAGGSACRQWSPRKIFRAIARGCGAPESRTTPPRERRGWFGSLALSRKNRGQSTTGSSRTIGSGLSVGPGGSAE